MMKNKITELLLIFGLYISPLRDFIIACLILTILDYLAARWVDKSKFNKKKFYKVVWKLFLYPSIVILTTYLSNLFYINNPVEALTAVRGVVVAICAYELKSIHTFIYLKTGLSLSSTFLDKEKIEGLSKINASRKN
jgi:hypothetical protein